MSKFKVELRLPIETLRKAPFVYVGPDFRSLPLGILSDIVEHRGRKIQRLNPFTVVKSGDDGGQTDVLFCFTFFYINDLDERVVYLTNPIQLVGSGETGALEALFAEAERLAKFLESHLIEIELHDRVSGSVAFPSSLSFLSYNLESDALSKPEEAHLKRWGFREEAQIICFEQDVDEFERIANEIGTKQEKFIAKSLSPIEFVTLKAKSRNFLIRSYELTQSDGAFKPTNLPFFEDTAYSVRTRHKLIFGKGSGEGYLRWIPNIIEPFVYGRTPLPLLFYHALEEHAYGYGKIIDWGLSAEDEGLLASLITRAVESMRQRGIKKCQFANVNGNQRFVNSFVEEHGFKIVHKMRLLCKEAV